MASNKFELGFVILCWAATLSLPALADEPSACAKPGLTVDPIVATHLIPPDPKESQRRHEEGTTVALVNIATDGTPTQVTVAQPSGSDRLDDAVLKFAQAHWRWQPPMLDCKPTTAQVHVRVVWHHVALTFLPPDPEFKVQMPPTAYPPGAVTKLEEGTTLLQIEVDEQRVITDARVILTSGYSDLDDQALSIVKKSAELMKGQQAGTHVLSATWALPPGTFPPDYETMWVTGIAVRNQ